MSPKAMIVSLSPSHPSPFIPVSLSQYWPKIVCEIFKSRCVAEANNNQFSGLLPDTWRPLAFFSSSRLLSELAANVSKPTAVYPRKQIMSNCVCVCGDQRKKGGGGRAGWMVRVLNEIEIPAGCFVVAQKAVLQGRVLQRGPQPVEVHAGKRFDQSCGSSVNDQNSKTLTHTHTSAEARTGLVYIGWVCPLSSLSCVWNQKGCRIEKLQVLWLFRLICDLLTDRTIDRK